MKRFIPFILSLLIILQFSCQESAQNNEKDHTPTIVTTTGIIEDLVKEIVGKKANVVALMGPGVDPHLYTAAQSDLKILKNADVIIYNGLHLEGKISDILHKLSKKKAVFAVADGLEEADLRKTSDNNAYDPHIWFNAKLWIKGAHHVLLKLQEAYPEHTVEFQDNFNNYYNSLARLDIYAKDEISKIPESQRILITAHDAFEYFGEAYGIEVIGFQGLSTVTKAGIHQRTRLKNLIIEKNIKAVFIESTINPEALEALIEDCEKEGHIVKEGGPLYSDALGAKDSGAETYVGMFRENIRIITSLLK